MGSIYSFSSPRQFVWTDLSQKLYRVLIRLKIEFSCPFYQSEVIGGQPSSFPIPYPQRHTIKIFVCQRFKASQLSLEGRQPLIALRARAVRYVILFLFTIVSAIGKVSKRTKDNQVKDSGNVEGSFKLNRSKLCAYRYQKGFFSKPS